MGSEGQEESLHDVCDRLEDLEPDHTGLVHVLAGDLATVLDAIYGMAEYINTAVTEGSRYKGRPVGQKDGEDPWGVKSTPPVDTSDSPQGDD